MRGLGHDRIFLLSFLPAALILGGVLLVFLITLFNSSFEALRVFGPELFLRNMWDPERELYGLAGPVLGTFVTSIIAVVVSLFFSIPLSIFLHEFLKGRIREIMASVIELMGGIPTIVYAMWSLNYLAPFLKTYVMEPLYSYMGFIPLFSCSPVANFSVFTAGVAIGISLTPYVTSIIVESYRLIPSTYREACLGIGATRYETVRITLSLARPAILAAALLGFARAAGETTIAVSTIGNAISLSPCLFAPGSTVPALIASQYGNANLHVYAGSVLHASALVILVTTLVLCFAGLRILDKWRVRVVA